MDLMDLVIYSNEDGEEITRYATEHITKFMLNRGQIRIVSTQRIIDQIWDATKVSFYFEGR